MSTHQAFFADPVEAYDLLPEPARSKLLDLMQIDNDAYAMRRPITEQIQEKFTELQKLKARRRQLCGSGGRDAGYDLKDDAPQVVDIDKKIAALTSDIERQKELEEVRSHRVSQTAGLVRNLGTYARAGKPGGTTLVPILDCEPPPLKKGETIASAIEGRRRRLRELDADRHTVESALFPSSVAKAKAAAQIEGLAAGGAPSVMQALAYGGDIEFATTHLRSTVHFQKELALAFADVPNVLGLVAWAFRKQLIDAINAEIDLCSDDANAFSDDQRTTRLATIAGDMLAVSREEEALICLAAASGTEVLRRPDAHPLAVLGLELLTSTRPAASVSPIVGFVKGLMNPS